MKKYAFAFSVILFAASLGLAISEYRLDQSAQKAAKVHQGEVLSVDSAKNQIAIKDDAGTEVRFTVNPSTKITREGKAISLADLKAGEKVSAECEEAADGWTAKSIQVVSMKPKQ